MIFFYMKADVMVNILSFFLNNYWSTGAEIYHLKSVHYSTVFNSLHPTERSSRHSINSKIQIQPISILIQFFHFFQNKTLQEEDAIFLVTIFLDSTFNCQHALHIIHESSFGTLTRKHTSLCTIVIFSSSSNKLFEWWSIYWLNWTPLL